jgi:hypothetical protein
VDIATGRIEFSACRFMSSRHILPTCCLVVAVCIIGNIERNLRVILAHCRLIANVEILSRTAMYVVELEMCYFRRDSWATAVQWRPRARTLVSFHRNSAFARSSVSGFIGKPDMEHWLLVLLEANLATARNNCVQNWVYLLNLYGSML